MHMTTSADSKHGSSRITQLPPTAGPVVLKLERRQNHPEGLFKRRLLDVHPEFPVPRSGWGLEPALLSRSQVMPLLPLQALRLENLSEES